MKITKLIFQLNYQSHILLFDKMNSLIYQIKNENTEISMDSNDQFLLYDKKVGVRFELTHQYINFQFLKSTENISETLDWMFNILKTINKLNPIVKVDRIALRAYSHKAVEMKFPELADLFHKKLFKSNEELVSIFEKTPDDLVYRINYEKEKLKYHFRSGPVQKEQLIQENGYNSKQLEVEEFVKFKKDLKLNSIFIDNDCFSLFKGIDIDMSNLRKTWEEMFQSVNKTGKQFSEYLVK